MICILKHDAFVFALCVTTDRFYHTQAMEAKKEESWKQKLPTKSKEYRNGGKLRDYQIEGEE